MKLRRVSSRRGATIVEMLVVAAMIITIVTALAVHGIFGAIDLTRSVIDGPGEPSVKAYNNELDEKINDTPQ